MKKTTAIALVMVILCSMLCLAGCKEKVSVTAEDYKNLMEAKGYTIADASEQFADYDEIAKVYIAVPGDGAYQIEFYELTSAEAAMRLFAGNKSIFEQFEGNASTHTSISAANYSNYKLTAGGYYKVLSRIDNTMIYIDAPVEFKDEIKTVLGEIGY